LPDPVDGQGTNGGTFGDLDIGLAPRFKGGSFLANSVEWLEHLSLLGNAAAVDLMAATIIVVLSSEEKAVLVAASALLVPLHHINKFLFR
jgi:hypothetical protein